MDNNRNFGRYGQDYQGRNAGPRDASFQNEQQNEKAKTEAKPAAKLEFGERDFATDFPVIERLVTTTNSICKLISSYLRSCLADYNGCFVTVTPINGQNIVTLNAYFKEGASSKFEDASKIKVIDRVVQEYDRRERELSFEDINRYNYRFGKHQYMLTEDGKSVFSELIIKQKREPKNIMRSNYDQNKEFNLPWKQIVTEVQDNSIAQPYYNNAGSVLVRVSLIDFVAVLAKIYGEEVNGEKLIYRATIGAPVQMKDGIANNIMIIERMKEKDSRSVMDYSGRPMIANGTVPRV